MLSMFVGAQHTYSLEIYSEAAIMVYSIIFVFSICPFFVEHARAGLWHWNRAC